MDAKMAEAGTKMMTAPDAKGAGAAASAPAAKAGSAGVATPAAKAGSTKAAPVAKAGGSALTSGKLLAATKAAVATPMFGVIAISSIIVFQWWKGSRDARQFSSSGE